MKMELESLKELLTKGVLRSRDEIRFDNGKYQNPVEMSLHFNPSGRENVKVISRALHG